MPPRITALTRPVSTSLPRCQLSFLPRRPIDLTLARAQHSAYEAALAACDAAVVRLPALDALADAVFVEDAVVVLDEVAIVTNPGVASRAGETETVAAAVGRFRPVRRLAAPATLDGGDVLRVGRTLYVGASTRTNAAGIDQVRTIAEPLGYAVVPVPVRGALHLKTACSYLGRGTALVNPEWVPTEPFAGLTLVAVDTLEPFAANVLRVHDTLVMASGFPRTAARLRAYGFATCEVDLSELQKAEAGPTCLSVLIEDRPAPS